MAGKKKRRKPISLVMNEWLYEGGRKFGAVLASISDVFERLIGEGVSGSGKSVKKLSVFLPLRQLASIRNGLSAVGKVIGRALARLGSWIAKLADRLLPKWLSRALAWPFVLIGTTGSFLLDFAGLWWWTREFKKLLWAIPAFVLAAPLIACMILSPLYSRSAKIVRYRQTMRDALEVNNQALADLCLAKLNQLGLNQAERAEFSAATTLASKGQMDAAREKMQRLAPVEVPGFPPAHAWLALQLMSGDMTPEKWHLIETHVGHALFVDPHNLFARRLQVEVDLYHDRNEQAVEAMKSLVTGYPDLNYPLLLHYGEMGDVVKARASARELVDYSHELHATQQLDLDELLRWAAAHEYLDQHDRAIEVLDIARQQYVDDERLNNRLTGTLLAAFWKHVEVRPVDAYAHLERALELRPPNNQVLVFLANEVAAGKASVIQFLEQRQTEDDLLLQVTLFAGDLHFRKADYVAALELYRQSCEIDPNAAGRGWNNQAWILADTEPSRLSEALEAANRAIEIDEMHPEFRETRGQIFLKLEQWEAAAADLQQALNGDLPNLAEVHRALAKAYEQLGEDELAAAHRRQAGG